MSVHEHAFSLELKNDFQGNFVFLARIKSSTLLKYY
jgi:hypothetical protein